MTDPFTRLLDAVEHHRPICLSSAEAMAIVGACREPLENAATEIAPYYLNEYRTNRAWGGPEEGGWWYDTGEFLATRGSYKSRAGAEQARETLESEFARKQEECYPPSSVLCDGWPELLVEREPGQSFPTERPRYE